jgi:transposase
MMVLTNHNNFIKLFIINRGKTVLFISMKKYLLLLVCKVDKLLILDLLNVTG